jgi:hypothetical protein
MEKLLEATAEIDRVSGHVRLIADLMLAGTDLHDVDRGAFAQVLHDLAVRLDRAAGALEDLDRSARTAEEAQP